MSLLTHSLTFMAGEPTLTNISFRFEPDGILEGNETFVLTYTGVGNGLAFDGATEIDALEATIIDVDGKL